MKVTDYMVDSFLRALSGDGECGDDVRCALEAALADVPDHDALLRATTLALADYAAKLAKVREWAERYPISADLLGILDGD